MQDLEFEQQETNDFEFFNFEKEGSSFVGTFKQKHDGETTEPKAIEGFMFKTVEGDNVMLPNYHQIGKFIDEKTAEGIDMTKRIMKIEYVKKVDIGGGKTMKRFNFFLAKEANTTKEQNPINTGSGETKEEETLKREEEKTVEETFSEKRAKKK